MGRLVSHLVFADENAPVAAFAPGSIVCLERDDDHRWRVTLMLRPDTLS